MKGGGVRRWSRFPGESEKQGKGGSGAVGFGKSADLEFSQSKRTFAVGK